MSDQRSYSTPEIVKLGDAIELTEGGGTPVSEDPPGSLVYYNANPARAEEDIDEDA